MIKTLVFAAALIVAATCTAQSALVIALSPNDAAQAKTLDEKLRVLTAQKADFDEHIKETYLKATGNTGSNCFNFDGKPVKLGWGCGDFEYSSDFLYIVPKTPSERDRSFHWGNDVVPTPAYGISNPVYGNLLQQ